MKEERLNNVIPKEMQQKMNSYSIFDMNKDENIKLFSTRKNADFTRQTLYAPFDQYGLATFRLFYSKKESKEIWKIANTEHET
jgi:hypothetical protein